MEDIDLGKQIKEKFENHEVQPSSSVWEGIENHLEMTPPMMPKRNFPWKNTLWVSTAIIVVATVSLWAYLDTEKKDSVNVQNTEVALADTNITKSSTESTPIIEQHISKPVQITQDNNTENSTKQSKEYTEKQNPNIPIASEKLEITKVQSPTNTLSQNSNSVQNVTAQHNLPNLPAAPPAVNKPLNKKATQTTTTPTPSTQLTEPANVMIVGKTTACKDEEVNLEARGGVSYLWNTYETTASIKVKPEETTNYFVLIKLDSGEEIEKQITITVTECERLYVPNAFTPNSDRNNLFQIFAQGVYNFEIIIMSRQGQQVFQSKDYNRSWDGTYKNEPMPAGTYMYIITYKNINGESKRKAGPITLIR